MQIDEIDERLLNALNDEYSGFKEDIEELSNVYNKPEGDDLETSLWSIAAKYASDFSDNPFIQVAETWRKTDGFAGGALTDMMINKIGNSFYNSTFKRQVRNLHEGINYIPLKPNQYNEDGLQLTFSADLPKAVLNIAGEALNAATLGYGPNLSIQNKNNENNILSLKGKKSALMKGENPLSYEDILFGEGIVNPTEEQLKKLRTEIEMPYSTFNFHQLKGSDKYPIVSIFGDTQLKGKFSKYFGINLVKSAGDKVSRKLTEEYLWLSNQNANLSPKFPEKNISVELFEAGENEKRYEDNNISTYKGTIKLNERDNAQRAKLLGDLYKERMKQIITNPKDPLNFPYIKYKNRVNEINSALKDLSPDNDQYGILQGQKHNLINDLSSIWDLQAKAIRHAVDIGVYGKEMNNVRMWKEFTDTYVNNPMMLKHEFKTYYPDASDEEILQFTDEFLKTTRTEDYSRANSNIQMNEVYRKWKKKQIKNNNSDREYFEDHVTNKKGLKSMSELLKGNSAIIDKRKGTAGNLDMIYDSYPKDLAEKDEYMGGVKSGFKLPDPIPVNAFDFKKENMKLDSTNVLSKIDQFIKD